MSRDAVKPPGITRKLQVFALGTLIKIEHAMKSYGMNNTNAYVWVVRLRDRMADAWIRRVEKEDPEFFAKK